MREPPGQNKRKKKKFRCEQLNGNFNAILSSESGSRKRKNKKALVCRLCERQMQAQMQGGACSSAI